MTKIEVDEAKRQLKAQIDQLYRAVHRAESEQIDQTYLAKAVQAIDTLIARFQTWAPKPEAPNVKR